MRHRTKTDVHGNWIKLVKKSNPKTGRKHYSVILDPYIYAGGFFPQSKEVYHLLRQSWRDHFDPAGNRGMKTGLSWKFTNKEQAEKLITMALLKWGDRYGGNS